ncbi:MAG TPA: DUF4962 domain-containing protein [Armatimonadetes bacterium]|nr:DUF4962 domain-containing protein [Armatimonadota bacterium]
MRMDILFGLGLTLVLTGCVALAGALRVDETPAQPGEWGFRPAEGAISPLTPPAFAWRPQRGAVRYTLQCSQDPRFTRVDYQVDDLTFNVHCPPKVFPPGRWFWRFRFRDKRGHTSAWSQPRTFTIPQKAIEFPLPPREELLARVPRQHPRLFVRPEQLPRLRELAQGELKPLYDQLVETCEKLLKDPPPTEEPPKYPPGMKRGSDPWRKIWWGNRTYTIRLLNGAATLAFTRLLGGKEEYGQLARRLLLEAAKWDPKGSTGYRYNDEAGMPYAYYFSRTYTFLYDLLTEGERAQCRKVMRVRGEEMYRHLCPRHLWRPYASHSNRAWHFLGEVAIAFWGEIPEAEDWLWFVLNVFANLYPVWNDAEGGWHEGLAYWRSYINRFTWWADVMRVALGIDAYRKPYFSQIGYYPLYLQPPGTKGGGFGDLCAWLDSRGNVPLMSIFAVQARNPYWQWYVEAQGGPVPAGGYIGFIRGALPKVEAKPPTDLPTSRCFWGTGQAMLNTNLLDAKDNVEIIFKSSPFGSQSHGYEAQNSFLLYAFGERLLIRTGRRDSYGSEHHRNWMWETKSTNCITVNRRGQIKHSPAAQGKITEFHTSKTFDYVEGEAGMAYGDLLERFTRRILFVKPELVVIFDHLKAAQPSTFEWWLHAPTRMTVKGQGDIRVQKGEAACRVAFLAPEGLKLTQTDQFDPPPRPRIKLVEYHLTARTSKPAREMQFVTLLRPHRVGEAVPEEATLEPTEGGYLLRAQLAEGEVVVLLRTQEGVPLTGGGLTTEGEVAAARFDGAGQVVGTFAAGGR